MLDVDMKGAAKIAVDEAATTLVPAIAAALEPLLMTAVTALKEEIAQLGPALISELDGLTITITRKPRQ